MTVVVVRAEQGAEPIGAALAARGVLYRVAPGSTSLPTTVEVVFADGRRLVDPSDAEIDGALADSGSTTPRVVERPDDRRFELVIDDEVVSFATYSLGSDRSVVVPHVETRMEHRGNGRAAQLMDGMLGLLRSSGRQIVPLCPFAADHVRSEARHHDLLAR